MRLKMSGAFNRSFLSFQVFAKRLITETFSCISTCLDEDVRIKFDSNSHVNRRTLFYSEDSHPVVAARHGKCMVAGTAVER